MAADELEQVSNNWQNELLPVKQAAEESGYSAENLRRKVREGQLPAERSNGKKSHIKLRRGDLPTKPGHSPDSTSSSQVHYDPQEDARDIAQRTGGLNG